ncbi:hypothetical protein ART_0636 [Arthrobacter sp. PAMC 25486]|nr:hypothetical protein ART_0636 [Arthrobacter sp. PAMC 25486]
MSAFSEPAYQPVESGSRWQGNCAGPVLGIQRLADLVH